MPASLLFLLLTHSLINIPKTMLSLQFCPNKKKKQIRLDTMVCLPVQTVKPRLGETSPFLEQELNENIAADFALL